MTENLPTGVHRLSAESLLVLARAKARSDAIMARQDAISWEESYTGVGQLGENTDATPRDVALHPGAERWYRDHGFKV